jgi:uncharacterized protein
MPAPTLVPGAPCWIDLYTSDPERATDFYGSLFGWTKLDPGAEYGGYFLFQRAGKVVAGCMRNDGEQGVPDTWTIYLTTDDADRTAAAAREHGGTVLVEPMDVTENGRMAMVADPGGAATGIWQPRSVHGFEVRNEPGTPAWFELHTADYDRSVDFYRQVFGWDARTMSDEPDFRYTTLGEGDDALAGIMDSSAFPPAGTPAAWTVYVAVEDADAALGRVTELGGAVERQAEDTPYGRLAAATDPTGTRFKLVAR